MERISLQYKTASDYVYQQLRKQIFEKKLLSGQRLPEVAIAKELQVSRTPVREALRRLTNEGLVQIIPNWGASLVSPTKEEVFDTYEVRENLELMAIRKAVHKITPLQLCRLQEQIDAERKTFADRDLESYLKVNDEFHIIIAESSGNGALTSYIRNVLSRTFVQMIFFESFFDFDSNPSLEEHIALLAALEKRDEALCVKLMSEHIDLSIGSLKLDE
ncbi:GntR family transcriptional regulator [Synergistaceae bacterium OttesenSCG-928-D05]|nr:GntR family transcriptional regulator [Synergistaceae bacterium OttesenSCG-928-D05]